MNLREFNKNRYERIVNQGCYKNINNKKAKRLRYKWNNVYTGTCLSGSQFHFLTKYIYIYIQVYKFDYINRSTSNLFTVLYIFTFLVLQNTVWQTTVCIIDYCIGLIIILVYKRTKEQARTKVYRWKHFPSTRTTIQQLGNNSSFVSNFRTYSNLLFAIAVLPKCLKPAPASNL